MSVTEPDTKTIAETDHFGQDLVRYDEPAYGAGEACECTQCGQQARIALVAGTADPSNENWEEHYECDCGATGKFRAYGVESCEWVGQMEYPSGVY